MKQSGREPKARKRLLKHNRPLAIGMLWGGASVLLALICVTVMTPERFDLHVGEVAKKTITASKDVVDEMTTKQRRDAAAAQVHVVSYKAENVAGEVMQSLQAACAELRTVQQFGQGIREERTSRLLESKATAAPGQQLAGGDVVNQTFAYTSVDIQNAQALIPTVPLNNEQIRIVLDVSAKDLEDFCLNLTASVRTTVAATILEGEVSDAIEDIQRLVPNISSSLWWNVARPVLRACLQPNMIVDQESTEANREKARDEVEPTVYKQGENIVVAGERVTAPQLAVLHALGLIQGTRYDTELYIGISLLSALLMGGLWLYMALFVPEVAGSFSKQLLLLLILVLVLLLSIASLQVSMHLMPVGLGVLLVTILLGDRLALGANISLALFLGLLVLKGSTANSAQAIAVVLMTVLGGLTGIWAVRRRASRSKVLLCGLYIGITNALVLFSAGMIINSDLRIVLEMAGFGMISGVVSAILCVGIQPALEVLFNLVTPAKLLELCNPNHALLRRLMIEAPGTYHHSMVVANIAEAAAESIGMNALLARVGAYYHDVGKLKRPAYFKENQTGENPHDSTDPRVSTAILVAHVRDGIALGQRHRLPQPVLDIIAQHHGDTPVLFFYHKAVQLCEGQPVDIKDFRYEGPKPQTGESALIMLADTVEAAVRTIQDATPEKVVETIRRLVKGKVEDGQLDATPLTFRDIAKICTAFEQVLAGVFHERIEYPRIEIHPVKELPKEVEAYMAEQQEFERALGQGKEENKDGKKAASEAPVNPVKPTVAQMSKPEADA